MTRRVQCSFVLIGVLALSACASLSLKQRAVVSLQATHAALSAAQDFERQAYATHSVPGLTPLKHQELAMFFSHAFESEIKATVVLKAWKAGDPVPSSLAELQADSASALVVLKQLLPGSAGLVDKIQAIADEAFKVAALLKGA